MASEFPAGPFRATLTSRTALTNDIVDLEFAMLEPPRLAFRAGQFVSIHVGRDAAGLPARRSYSIASPSHTGDVLRFIVRIIPSGAASDFLVTVPIGTEVAMTGPHGFFVLEARHAGDVVFGATGTGTAAILPMLAELAARPTPEKRAFYWGARHAEDLFARDEVEQLCAQARTSLHVCLTSPPPHLDRRARSNHNGDPGRLRGVENAYILSGGKWCDDWRGEKRTAGPWRGSQEADPNRSLFRLTRRRLPL